MAGNRGGAVTASSVGAVARYRPDIDGLRAVAVLGVLLYHLDVKLVPGGFAGVDVFFVISGFLITQLIRDELKSTGGLDFTRFYLRRVRRLFPALLLTVIAVLICATAVFLPEHLERLGGASLHALLSLSNLFFWSESGYFDADSRFKPLLHTWSLGVEAQFYLVWPVMLVALYRILGERAIIAFLMLAAAASLALNIIFLDGQSALLTGWVPGQAEWLSDGKATIFYLLPFRIFEFAIGAGLVWMVDARQATRAWVSDILFIGGLGLILFTFATVTNTAPWPHFGALMPCLGTAMVILAGRSRLTGPLLANRPMVALGLVSYALYLVHWPIIVFVNYVTFEPLTPQLQALIALASIGLAALVYRAVEQPYRKPPPSRALSPAGFCLACAAATLVVVVPSASMWANQGWPWRHEALVDAQAVEDYKTARFTETVNACMLVDAVAGTQLRRADGQLRCRMDAAVQIVVMGDSHAVDSLNTLTELYRDRPDRNIIYALKDGGEDACLFRAGADGLAVHDLNRAGCATRADALNSDVWQNVDLIVLDVFDDQSRHYGLAAAILARYPEVKLVVMGPYIGTRPYNCSDLANRFRTFDACKDDRFVSVFGVDRGLETLLPSGSYSFVDRRSFFCDETLDIESCATTIGRAPIFVDGDHLTLEASRYIARRLRSDGSGQLGAAGLPP